MIIKMHKVGVFLTLACFFTLCPFGAAKADSPLVALGDCYKLQGAENSCCVTFINQYWYKDKTLKMPTTKECPVGWSSSSETCNNHPFWCKPKESTSGNVFPAETPMPCQTAKDCVIQNTGAPGGLSYGCLPDIQLCGYLKPGTQSK